jgi:hypothetical protein
MHTCIGKNPRAWRENIAGDSGRKKWREGVAGRMAGRAGGKHGGVNAKRREKFSCQTESREIGLNYTEI